MKLRDFYSSLEILCDDMGLIQEELEGKLDKVGYKYDKTINQFK